MTDYTITQTAGAKSANSISADFTNTAGAVAGNTTWTTGSVLYLRPTDNTDFVVKSISGHDTRDMEVTTWMRVGYVFLRLDGTGKAIYFFHNGESTNGTLEIGIVTGLTESAYPSGTSYTLYSNTDCVTSFGSAGYNKAGDTTGDAFTFGVSGFDIYVEFNGTEVCRFKEYRHMAVGAMACKSSTLTNNGFRDITHSTLSTVTLASDYASNEINMGDWGVRALATTGSISASSTTLTVADATGFQIGDYVLVEIGGESVDPVRGKIGVGGVWPRQSYATTATLLAATPATNLFAYAVDTGIVYRYLGSGNWDGNTDNVLWNDTRYYGHKAIPRSLRAKITGIAGSVFTLDTSFSGGLTGSGAAVSTTNANVYLDNQLYFNDVLQTVRTGPVNLSGIAWPSMTVTIPAGSFRMGGGVRFNARNGIVFQGLGQGVSTLIGCDGMSGAAFFAQECPEILVKDYTTIGNLGVDYFGLNFVTDNVVPTPGGTQYNSSGQIITVSSDVGAVDEDDFDAHYITSGIWIEDSDDSVVQDITGQDVFTNVVTFQDSNDCWGYRCTGMYTEEVKAYIQWTFELADGSTGGGYEDCVIDSNFLYGGFEAFGGSGQSFIRCSTRNAAFSLNSSGGWLMEDCSIVIEAGTRADNLAWSINNALVSITASAGDDPVLELGGIINNIDIWVQGVVDDDDNIPEGIVSNPTNPNITVTGGRARMPDYVAGVHPGPIGINLHGTGNVVTGFRCCGQVDLPVGAQQANIYITDGTVTGCVADSIVIDTTILPLDGTNGNISCAMAPEVSMTEAATAADVVTSTLIPLTSDGSGRPQKPRRNVHFHTHWHFH